MPPKSLKNQKIICQRSLKSFQKKGFTLVEILVSITISVLLLVTVLGSFWSLMSVSQKNEASRILQKQANFALIRLSDKVKNYAINYAAHENSSITKCKPFSAAQSSLCLIDNTGVEINFDYNTTNKQFLMDDQSLFSDYFEVTKVFFSVSPEKNPFDPSNISDKKYQLQPKVTFFISVASKKFPEIKLDLQTTISSRKYSR